MGWQQRREEGDRNSKGQDEQPKRRELAAVFRAFTFHIRARDTCLCLSRASRGWVQERLHVFEGGRDEEWRDEELTSTAMAERIG